MNGISDFVAGGYPLPWEPVWHPSIGDFVMGGFPLPQGPVFMPSANGSLPKAPDMPRAAIAHGSAGAASTAAPTNMAPTNLSGLGCGCGSVRGFSGMGALSTTDFGLVSGDTIIPQASLPTFLQGDNWITGFPNLYTAIGVGVLALVIGSSMGGGRRRR